MLLKEFLEPCDSMMELNIYAMDGDTGEMKEYVVNSFFIRFQIKDPEELDRLLNGQIIHFGVISWKNDYKQHMKIALYMRKNLL